MFDQVSSGKKPPHDVNVIVEIPAGSSVKYEIDKETGALFVDRFLHAFMHYPTNYGYIPHTLSEDGDPVDGLVFSDEPVAPGCVIRARPVGVLKMEDDKGLDEKILLVPHEKIDPSFKKVNDYTDLPEILIDKIRHFFERYKDLEKGKWVKILGWGDAQEAARLIQEGVDRAKK